MYGKSYESQYEGSLVGAGLNVFAVWGYIITKCRTGTMEINPKLLSFILGGTEKEIEDALTFLQEPDPASRSSKEGGRRLVKEGQYQYRVVNWEEYNRIRSEADRREYNRIKQAEFRAKEREALRLKREKENRKNGFKKFATNKSPGELAHEHAQTDEQRNAIIAAHLPPEIVPHGTL